MGDRELYQQKFQAKLDEWQTEIDKLKMQATEATEDSKEKISHQIETLEGKMEKARSKLSELIDASDDTWESKKGDVEAFWTALN